MKKNCSLLLGVAGVAISCGCTHYANKHHKTSLALDEHSRALTTGVVDVLNLQPSPSRDSFTEVALQLAREDQRIEGLPPDPIPVEPLVTGQAQLTARFAEIEKLLARRQKTAERLLEFGGQFEEQRNRSRARVAKWFSGGGLTLGGLIALCVFVPAAIPILGRILAWIVGKIPSLAGAIGVVGVKAFDAVARGIERTKDSRFSNEAAADSHNSHNSHNNLHNNLHINLSREMDASHKALVRSRKATFN